MRRYFGEGVDRLIEIGKGWAEGRGTEVLAEHWETLSKKSIDYGCDGTSGSWRSISRLYRAAARSLARSGQLVQPGPGAEC